MDGRRCIEVTMQLLWGLLPIGAMLATTPARGQIVQLPTFRVFSVSTTVVVPDRGHALLGGVSRSRSSLVERGVPLASRLPGVGRGFRTTARSSSASYSAASVSATIIDHDELDRAVLAEAARRRGVSHDIWGRPVATAPRISVATQEVAKPGDRGSSRGRRATTSASRSKSVADVLSAHQIGRAGIASRSRSR